MARKDTQTVKEFLLLNWTVVCMRGGPKELELSSGGWDPCSTGFPHWVGILGTHLYQCTSWCCCERLPLDSVNFFWRLNAFAHYMMGDLWMHLPTPHWVFSNFWPKNARPLVSHPITLSCPWAIFYLFASLDEKIFLKRNVCWCGRGNRKKNGISIKRHQNQLSLKTVLSSGKKSR